MRHLNAINHLGRKSADRKAMLANLASSLIIHKRITTTTAKARALRRYVEPLITKSKDDSTHSRRMVFSYLGNKEAVSELFREVAPRIASRPGGYTRILKMGNRLGDAAEMCFIELVDFNENMLAEVGAKAKSTRRRRTPKKKVAEATVAAIAKAPAEETAAEVQAPIDKPAPAVDQAQSDAPATAVDQAPEETETTHEENSSGDEPKV
ncbi:MAG: 50S ribosomal protein L17 [Bacteroidales bacterium]|jgi:large subunit ribosomal protein L17|nr:50S ribosomal protein L17 [Bacteroidales bacterium]